MKTVNQTSGKDMDSNNIELRLVKYEPHFEKTCFEHSYELVFSRD